MKLPIWIDGFLIVSLFFQVNSSADDGPKANLTGLQEKVEKLIETVMSAIQEYYEQSEREYKCLPDRYTDELMKAVRDGIDCVEESHKRYQKGEIEVQEHRKEFLKCFTKAKNTVEQVLQNLDPVEYKCPPEMVEKTFQINITTSYTKTFNLNIQNGVQVLYNKTIQVTRHEEPCRNYPDVFSFVEKPVGGRITGNRTSGILHHNLGGWIDVSKISVKDEYTTSRNLKGTYNVRVPNPGIERPKQKPRDETAYAYFEQFQNSKDRPSEGRDVLRKIRDPVLKERQPEVVV